MPRARAKARSKRVAVGVSEDVLRELDEHRDNHPLKPSRGRLADVAIREFLAAHKTRSTKTRTE